MSQSLSFAMPFLFPSRDTSYRAFTSSFQDNRDSFLVLFSIVLVPKVRPQVAQFTTFSLLSPTIPDSHSRTESDSNASLISLSHLLFLWLCPSFFLSRGFLFRAFSSFFPLSSTGVGRFSNHAVFPSAPALSSSQKAGCFLPLMFALAFFFGSRIPRFSRIDEFLFMVHGLGTRSYALSFLSLFRPQRAILPFLMPSQPGKLSPQH